MPRNETRTVLAVVGMRDNRCREIVTAALESVVGVREVDVNLYRARATVVHEDSCRPKDLEHAVEQAGYRALWTT